MSGRYTVAYYKNRLLAGFTAITNPRKNPFLVSKHVRYYWKKKILHKNFHKNTHGGVRHIKFNKKEQNGLHLLIRKKLLEQPHTSFCSIISYVKQFNYIITKDYISKLLKKWRWSPKISSEEQIQKYSIKNVEYYVDYLLEIQTIPWHHIKFLDESHFRASGAFLKIILNQIKSDLNISELHNRRVWSPIGKAITATRKAPLDMGYSLTIMTSLSVENPILVDLRYKSNTQYDFFAFVAHAIESKFLVPGDVLVVDNARIHFAEETAEAMDFMLHVFGIRILHLPTYSCELNPCELVFNFVKHHARTNRDEGKAFWTQILAAVAEVNILHLYKWYDHCINCF